MKPFGLCTLSVIPVRKEPSDKSEMVTQLLFGDMVEFLDNQKQWIFIRNTFDDYLGWIDGKQISNLSSVEYEQFLNTKENIKVFEHLLPITKNKHSQIFALMGSEIHLFKNNSFIADGQTYQINSLTTKNNYNIKSIALKYLYTPYLWGGKTAFGIDCSGFTQIVFKLLGIKLYRDAYQQAEQGKTIDFVSEAQIGDLAFFDNDKGNIIHTGIIIGKNEIIHASGFVRIDKIDHEGIYNLEEQQYTHKLRLIKRIL